MGAPGRMSVPGAEREEDFRSAAEPGSTTAGAPPLGGGHGRTTMDDTVTVFEKGRGVREPGAPTPAPRKRRVGIAVGIACASLGLVAVFSSPAFADGNGGDTSGAAGSGSGTTATCHAPPAPPDGSSPPAHPHPRHDARAHGDVRQLTGSIARPGHADSAGPGRASARLAG
ncbi:hypothetical protein CmiCFBP2404_12525 [Clavibacter michiganensis subsp. insidiosus]|nr:hypothetical protein B5P21_13570 [Clavibacter michiganensis subsp. insidiosus]RMC84124.1 hypothetical protein CmiCFBP2404_12525 [Clavibacter michiganensis subsp. insidiosus]